LKAWLEGHGLEELEERKEWQIKGDLLGELDMEELKALKTCRREERPTGVVDVLFVWEGVEEVSGLLYRC